MKYGPVLYSYVYVYIYIFYIRVCVYIYIYIYIFTHTYTSYKSNIGNETSEVGFKLLKSSFIWLQYNYFC